MSIRCCKCGNLVLVGEDVDEDTYVCPSCMTEEEKGIEEVAKMDREMRADAECI